MARNERAKTVDRAGAYEVRKAPNGEIYWALKYSHAEDQPYSRVKVSHGEDFVGHDIYVSEFKQYELIANPLAPTPVATPLTKRTEFPSTRELLEAGVSCREPVGNGWAVYWMEGGAELILFPGGEGPQEMSSIDELIEAIGGDQPCVLTLASIKRFGTMEALQAHLNQPVPPAGYTQLEFSDYIHVSCCTDQDQVRTTYEQMIDAAMSQ